MRQRLFLFIPVPLLTLFLILASFGTAVAAGTPSAHHAAVATPTLDVSGTWKFKTTDVDYPTFTLIIQQNGTMLSGQDGSGQRMKGGIIGAKIHFFVIGVSSEDDYGGRGTVGSKGVHMQGSFWDGFGGTGTFIGTKVG